MAKEASEIVADSEMVFSTRSSTLTLANQEDYLKLAKSGPPVRASQEDEKPLSSPSPLKKISDTTGYTLPEKAKLYGDEVSKSLIEPTTVWRTSFPSEASSVVKDKPQQVEDLKHNGKQDEPQEPEQCVSCHRSLPPMLCNFCPICGARQSKKRQPGVSP